MNTVTNALISALLPYLIIFAAIVIAVALIAKFTSARQAPAAATIEKTVYSYGRKDYLMTKAENDFFAVLKESLQERYQIFPQVHLSALLDETKVKGQNWNAAFRHINGKSVDFVVCDSTYTRPLLAIELDDFTHDTQERRGRDMEVERIFENANMPLLRFRDYKTMSRDAIAAQIEDALRKTSQAA